MKKIILVSLLILLAHFSLSSQEKKTNLKFALLNGPSAVGALKMMSDNKNIDFSVLPSPDNILPGLIKGEYDFAVLPSNLGAIIYNRKIAYKVAAVVGDSAFSIVSRDSSIKSVKDLKGKTIYCAGKGATPEFVLRYLIQNAGLKESDVVINYSLGHQDLAKALISKVVNTAFMVEPFTTMSLSEAKDLSIVIDPQKIVNNPITVLLVRESLIKSNPSVVKEVMLEYKNSIEYVKKNNKDYENMLKNTGITITAKTLQIAMPRMGINYYDGSKMEEALNKYYKFLYDFEPKSIGGSLPKNDLYYR